MNYDYDAELSHLIKSLHPQIYSDVAVLPRPHKGTGLVKAIVLDADPSWNGRTKEVETVFDIDPQNGSPFFNPILKNLQCLGLTLDTIYVQNLVKNYFTLETSKINSGRNAPYCGWKI